MLRRYAIYLIRKYCGVRVPPEGAADISLVALRIILVQLLVGVNLRSLDGGVQRQAFFRDLVDPDAVRGDGSTHYTGGGLLAKWTARHGFYVEGSLRAGSVHDDARNVLRDVNGVPYSYETNAPYMGFHLGVGKEFTLNNGNVVDVYGKYFCNRRNSVDFNAGWHYNLDTVTSSVIRLGARYTVKSRKWNFYAGAAYEHEFDGKANGTADGVAIRGADTSGGSFRGELGGDRHTGQECARDAGLQFDRLCGEEPGPLRRRQRSADVLSPPLRGGWRAERAGGSIRETSIAENSLRRAFGAPPPSVREAVPSVSPTGCQATCQ